MGTPRVFISMGTPYTPKLEDFRNRLEDTLRTRCNVDPRIIGRNEYPAGNPLTKIVDVMKSCDGVLVVAYERKYLEAGKEKRGSQAEKSLANNGYTTPWNHIESAMAFTLGLPIYVISQKGVVAEGLIESKIDWYVQEVDFDADIFDRPAVVDSLRAWADDRVRPHQVAALASKPRELSNLRLKDFTLTDWSMILAFAGACFVAGSTIGPYVVGLFS